LVEFCDFKLTAQSKHVPIGRKFVQSGHPAYFRSCFFVGGVLRSVPRLRYSKIADVNFNDRAPSVNFNREKENSQKNKQVPLKTKKA
jgi:hypothetical protein